MMNKTIPKPLLAFLSLIACLIFIACPTSEESGRTMTMQIDEDNDSLLTFDSLIIKVYNKDRSFSQEVFHGVLRDPKQVVGLPLDSRIGEEYTVSIVGYRNGKVGVNKEVTVLGPGDFESKDLGLPSDTVKIEPTIPEILVPADTSVAEEDSLRLPIPIRNPWNGATLTVKNAPTGSVLDTTGLSAGLGLFSWRPNLSQGRNEPYAVTFVYASSDRKVEKTIAVKVRNKNQPPKIKAIPDQKIQESETLTFKVEATDPDQDSLTLSSSVLPEGATFSSGTFTWKTSVDQAENYSIKFKASDGQDSNWITVLIAVGNVTVPPPLEVIITSPGRDTAVNITPIIIHYSVNGASLQKTVPLKDGKNKIAIDTTISGRTDVDTVTVTLDTMPPEKPIVNGASPVRTRTPSWTWTSGGNGIGTYRSRLDNNDMASSTASADTAYIPSKELDPGIHTLFIQEQDEAGNWSQSGRHSIRIDTTRPIPPKVENPASPTNNTTPTWAWVGSDDDVSGLFRYKLNDPDLRSGATETRDTRYTPGKATPLNEGSHILYVQQQDSAGNWSNAGNASVKIDVTPPEEPVFNIFPISPLNSLNPVWTWNDGSDGGNETYRCKLDDPDLEKDAVLVKGGNYSASKNLREGPHTLYLQQRDSAGNWSPATSKTLVLSPRGTVGVAGFSTGRVNFLSLAINGTGIPYVALADSVHGYKATVMRWNGTTWEYVGTPSFSAGSVGGFCMVISGGGIPYIAFQDWAENGKVTVMRWGGSAWEYVGSPGFSVARGDGISLAISSSGVPYVAFQDWANNYKATVMRWSGTAWEYIGNPGFSSGSAGAPSLAINATGALYVAFQDGESNNKASVMRWSGVAWEYLGGPGVSAGYGDYLSLALSSIGIPYVAFRDGANSYRATVKKWNGTDWEYVGSPGFSVGSAGYLSLVISGTGLPYLAFQDGVNGDKATVLRWSGTTWDPVGSPGLSAGRATYISLAINTTDVPYVAFQDGANGEKATIIRASFDP